MAQYSVHDAKTHLSRLIAEALSGEEVVIARGKSPVVRLSPVTPPGRRQFGAFKGRINMDDRFNDPLPPEDLEGWGLA
ncbi:type II toxin-antitoxin system Phd/YefM family antitoxin [Phenylobacterium sp.]|jgi:antitoxin (DNA-binding transcriptional repressor) of toxin-antitoxin stability system|uniref:type II toxin-antitoxin system Phd/YefM family antitoxin n=1 Tax=Phenylobacterium sp. TaxID=1871053 RepID=UPI0037CBC340